MLQVWRLADADGDGNIGMKELQMLMDKVNGRAVEEEKVRHVMYSLDSVERNGRISYEEFRAAVLKITGLDAAAVEGPAMGGSAAGADAIAKVEAAAREDVVHAPDSAGRRGVGIARAGTTGMHGVGDRVHVQEAIASIFKIDAATSSGGMPADAAGRVAAALSASIKAAGSSGAKATVDAAAAASAETPLAEDMVGGLFTRILALHPVLAAGAGPAGVSQETRKQAWAVAAEVSMLLPDLNRILTSPAISDVREWLLAARAARLMLSVRDYWCDVDMHPLLREGITTWWTSFAASGLPLTLLNLLHPRASDAVGLTNLGRVAAVAAAPVAVAQAHGAYGDAAAGAGDVPARRYRAGVRGRPDGGYDSPDDDDDDDGGAGAAAAAAAHHHARKRLATDAAAAAAAAAGIGAGAAAGSYGTGTRLVFGAYEPSPAALELLATAQRSLPSLTPAYAATGAASVEVPRPALTVPCDAATWAALQTEALTALTYFVLGPRLPYLSADGGLCLRAKNEFISRGGAENASHIAATTNDIGVLAAAASFIAALASHSISCHSSVVTRAPAWVLLARFTDLAASCAAAAAAPASQAPLPSAFAGFAASGLGAAPVGGAGAAPAGTCALMSHLLTRTGAARSALQLALCHTAGLAQPPSSDDPSSVASPAPAVDAAAADEAKLGPRSLFVEAGEALLGAIAILCGAETNKPGAVSAMTIHNHLGAHGLLKALTSVMAASSAQLHATSVPAGSPPLATPNLYDVETCIVNHAATGRWCRSEAAIVRARTYTVSALGSVLPEIEPAWSAGGVSAGAAAAGGAGAGAGAGGAAGATMWETFWLPALNTIAGLAGESEEAIKHLAITAAKIDLHTVPAEAAMRRGDGAGAAAALGIPIVDGSDASAASASASARFHQLKWLADKIYVLLRARGHLLASCLRVLRALVARLALSPDVQMSLWELHSRCPRAAADLSGALSRYIACFPAGEAEAARKSASASLLDGPGLYIPVPPALVALFGAVGPVGPLASPLTVAVHCYSAGSAVAALALDPAAWRSASGVEALALAELPKLTSRQAAVAAVCRQVVHAGLRFVTVAVAALSALAERQAATLAAAAAGAGLGAAAAAQAKPAYAVAILSHSTARSATPVAGAAFCLSDKMAEALATLAAEAALASAAIAGGGAGAGAGAAAGGAGGDAAALAAAGALAESEIVEAAIAQLRGFALQRAAPAIGRPVPKSLLLGSAPMALLQNGAALKALAEAMRGQCGLRPVGGAAPGYMAPAHGGSAAAAAAFLDTCIGEGAKARAVPFAAVKHGLTAVGVLASESAQTFAALVSASQTPAAAAACATLGAAWNAAQAAAQRAMASAGGAEMPGPEALQQGDAPDSLAAVCKLVLETVASRETLNALRAAVLVAAEDRCRSLSLYIMALGLDQRAAVDASPAAMNKVLFGLEQPPHIAAAAAAAAGAAAHVAAVGAMVPMAAPAGTDADRPIVEAAARGALSVIRAFADAIITLTTHGGLPPNHAAQATLPVVAPAAGRRLAQDDITRPANALRNTCDAIYAELASLDAAMHTRARSLVADAAAGRPLGAALAARAGGGGFWAGAAAGGRVAGAGAGAGAAAAGGDPAALPPGGPLARAIRAAFPRVNISMSDTALEGLLAAITPEQREHGVNVDGFAALVYRMDWPDLHNREAIENIFIAMDTDRSGSLSFLGESRPLLQHLQLLVLPCPCLLLLSNECLALPTTYVLHLLSLTRNLLCRTRNGLRGHAGRLAGEARACHVPQLRQGPQPLLGRARDRRAAAHHVRHDRSGGLRQDGAAAGSVRHGHEPLAGRGRVPCRCICGSRALAGAAWAPAGSTLSRLIELYQPADLKADRRDAARASSRLARCKKAARPCADVSKSSDENWVSVLYLDILMLNEKFFTYWKAVLSYRVRRRRKTRKRKLTPASLPCIFLKNTKPRRAIFLVAPDFIFSSSKLQWTKGGNHSSVANARFKKRQVLHLASSSIMADEEEYVQHSINEVFVYKIPPKTTAAGHK